MEALSSSSSSGPVLGESTGRANVVRQIIKSGAPSAISRRTEHRYGSKLCEFFKRYLVESGRQLIQEASDRNAECMAQFYSCDCTPMKTAKRMQKGSVVRVGKFCREWLIERQLTTDGRRVAAVFNDGRLLESETMTDIGAAAMELGVGTLREEGFRGIASTLYVQDRGKNADKALRRFWLRRHKFQYSAPDRLPFPMGTNLDELEMKDWPQSLGCALHDFQNAGEKSVTHIIERAGGPGGGYSYLFLGFERWLFSRLHYEDARSDDVGATRAFFKLCNLSSQVVAAFEVLGFHVEGDMIFIASQYKFDDAAHELLLEVLLGAFGFVVFTLSRWLSVLRSANRLMFAWYIGLDSLVDYVTEEVAGSSFHLAGYRKYRSPRTRYFVVAAGLSMQPPEVMEGRLLADDRLFLLFQECCRAFEEAQEHVRNISDATWVILLRLLQDADGIYSCFLKSDVIGGVAIGDGYARRVCFRQFEEYPHRLAVNWGHESAARETYVRDNVSELLLCDDSEIEELDETTRKIYWCMKSRLLSVDNVVAAVLQWHAWSVTAELVEQGHGAFAAVRKQHTTFGAEHLQQQGFRRTFNSTRPKKDPRTKSIELLQNLIARTEEKQPQKARPVHVIKSDLEAEHIRETGRPTTAKERSLIQKRAVKKLETLTNANQLGNLRHRLATMVQQKQSENADIIAQARYFILQMQNEAQQEEQDRTAPGFVARMKLSDCRYSYEEIDGYAQGRWDELSHLQVSALREKARAPPNTADAWRAQQMVVKEPLHKRVFPRWIKRLIAQKTKRLLQVVRFTSTTSGGLYALIVWLRDTPQEVTFEILTRDPLPAPGVPRTRADAAEYNIVGPLLSVRAGENLRRTGTHIYETEPALHSVTRVEVAACVFSGGPHLYRAEDWEEVDLGGQAAGLEVKVEKPPQPVQKTADAAFAENYPGLDSPAKLVRQVDDEEAEQQKQLMQEKKKQLRENLAAEMVYKVVPRGAKSNMAKRKDGLFCDAYKVEATTFEAGAFLKRLKQPRGKQFGVAKYGASGATLLCLHYARRMSMLYQLYEKYGRSTPAQEQQLAAEPALQELEKNSSDARKARVQIDSITFMTSHLDEADQMGQEAAAAAEGAGVDDDA
eukprot:g19134.t1